MQKLPAITVLGLGALAFSALSQADPHVCIGSMTDIDVLFHVRHDEYFGLTPLAGRKLRLEYDGCGYRVHVGASSLTASDGDLLMVDRFGHVTKVVHLR